MNKTKNQHGEPWTLKEHPTSRFHFVNADSTPIYPHNKTHLARAVACVNGCTGINPEAVKDLLAAVNGLLNEPTLKQTIQSAEKRDMVFAESVPDYASDCDSIEHVALQARAAIAKAEEPTS